jgi:AcrR family transcriptional regulator
MSDLSATADAALDGVTDRNDAEISGCGTVRRGRPSIAEAEALSGRILDASWDVLLAGGFENFTFDRVARHAHIGKATIYSRFPGKIELMQALLLRRIEQRTGQLKQQWADLPVESAFLLRAADIMKMLFSPDGVMTERLIDWLDQEIGEGQQMRANTYRNAIESISHLLIDGPDATDLNLPDVDLAARLWIEGLIGHARLAYTEGASSPAEIDRWASDYTRFYFAGLRAMAAAD